MIFLHPKKCAWPNVWIEAMIIQESHKEQRFEDKSLCYNLLQDDKITYLKYIDPFNLIYNITHNKIQLEQQMSSNQQLKCGICNQNIQNFVTLVSHSLYGKYSSSQNFFYTKEVNEILEQAISPAYIQFQDNNYFDDDQQYLKREYKYTEYNKKIEMLSEYYKFHRDLPVWNDRHIEGTMGRYYSRVKDVDYKKIKSVLKRQQGISLTTHKSFSSIDDSEYTKKSRYSTMLNDLEHSNDSIFLKDFCQKIGKAFKKVKVENNFKGTYYSGQKKFEQFIKKQKKRIENNKKQENNGPNQNFNLNLKKMKFNPKLNTNMRDEQFTELKQMVFTSNHSVKDRRYATIKNTISVQKTTANQTISRQQKTRRQKSKNNGFSSRGSLSRKKSLVNALTLEISRPKSKPKTYNIASILQNNQNLKTINEIYRPSVDRYDKKQRQKISDDIGRKSSKQLVSRLKIRSSSQQNLPISSTLNRDASKKKLMTGLKSNRSSSQKNLPIKMSTIQLQNLKSVIERPLTARQSSTQKIVRANSTSKISNPNYQKQYTTNKIVGQKVYGKKRNSAIEEMLQKKLTGFKKRQPIF